MIRILFVTLLIFLASYCYADQIVDQGPGYLGRGYLQGKSLGRTFLPSATLWRKDLDGNQELAFTFSTKTVGEKPDSFQNSASPKINSFYFSAPIATEFNFVGIEFKSGSCAKPPSGKVIVFADGMYTALNPGDKYFLRKGQPIYLDFDVEGWENCSFEGIKFRYFLTGTFSLEEYPSRVTGNLMNGSKKSFELTVVTPGIYSPIFRYYAKNVSFPSLEKAFQGCQTNSFVRSYQQSLELPDSVNVGFKVACPPSSTLSWGKQKWLVENADSVRYTFQDVVAQEFSPYAPQLGNKAWYVNPDVPIYHYRTVEATGLVLPQF